MEVENVSFMSHSPSFRHFSVDNLSMEWNSMQMLISFLLTQIMKLFHDFSFVWFGFLNELPESVELDFFDSPSRLFISRSR